MVLKYINPALNSWSEPARSDQNCWLDDLTVHDPVTWFRLCHDDCTVLRASLAVIFTLIVEAITSNAWSRMTLWWSACNCRQFFDIQDAIIQTLACCAGSLGSSVKKMFNRFDLRPSSDIFSPRRNYSNQPKTPTGPTSVTQASRCCLGCRALWKWEASVIARQIIK